MRRNVEFRIRLEAGHVNSGDVMNEAAGLFLDGAYLDLAPDA